MTDAGRDRDSGRYAGSDDSGLATPNEGEPELVVVSDSDAAARLAAERIAAALVAAVAERGRADFCTTGGNTPIPIYRYLRMPPFREQIPWDRVHVWWGDDRFVPRDHPDSNTTSLDQVLIRAEAFSGQSGEGDSGTDVMSGEQAGVPLPALNVHPFPVDRALAEGRDNEWCAEQYAAEIGAQVPLDDGNWPVFDFILVGVGPDGHVLSCFPNVSPAFDSQAWALGVPAPTEVEPHIARVTLNPRILDAAPVMAVTWGEEKAEALGHVFGAVRDDRRWPVQRTRRYGAVWIVDEAAAVDIPSSLRT